jgi:hypothetical protein
VCFLLHDHQVCKQIKMADDQLQQQQSSKADIESTQHKFSSVWLAAFVQLIGLVAFLSSSEGVRAEWRQLARPTASLLEHAMHVLAQHTPDDAECYVLKTGMWRVVSSMLLDEGAVVPSGPLLMAALAERAEQQPAARPIAVPVAQQLFSMCVSALKLLAQQTEDASPLPGAKLPHGWMTTLERIQHTAMRMLRTDVLLLLDVKVPWAVLLLRCQQLALKWLQQAAMQLPTAQLSPSVGASSLLQQQQQQGQEGSTPMRRKQLAHHTHATLVLTAAASLSQVHAGLRMLWRCFRSWCDATENAATAAQSAFAQRPLLLSWYQLQEELLPAVQQVTLQLWHAGSAAGSKSSSCTAGTDTAQEHDLVAAVCRVLQGADAAYAAWVERWAEKWQRASKSFEETQASSASVDSACTTTADEDRELGQQQQQQQQQLWETLQQLLGSGELQSWLAAASSALPLRWCCNNPGCSNLGTAGSKARGSELRRVGGRQCSLCKCACYCSKVSCRLRFAGAAHFPSSAAYSLRSRTRFCLDITSRKPGQYVCQCCLLCCLRS